MTIPAVFANFFVFGSLIVPGDAAATANNIMANEGLFRIGICSFIIVIILDVVVAWALYILLKPEALVKQSNTQNRELEHVMERVKDMGNKV